MKKLLLIVLTGFLCACASQPSVESMSQSMNRQFELASYTSDDLKNSDFEQQAAFIYTVLSHSVEVWTHRMNGEVGNMVFVHESGAEIVFDANKNRVDSCENAGSFNYAHYQRQPLAHFTVDTLPWLLWGNCRQDSTTVSQRVEAYMRDFSDGLHHVNNAIMALSIPVDFDVTSPGNSEALAFFNSAFAAADYDINSTIAEFPLTDEAINDLLLHLNQGFVQLLN